MQLSNTRDFMLSAIILLISIVSFIFVLIFLGILFGYLSSKAKNASVSYIQDEEVEAINQDINLAQRLNTTTQFIVTKTNSNLTSLNAEDKAKISGIGPIAARPAFNTLYVMRQDFVIAEDTQKNKGEALFILIGGYFEIDVLRELNDEQLTQQFNNYLKQNTPRGFSILFHPNFSLLTMIRGFKVGACGAMGGSYNSDRHTGCEKAFLLWNSDKFWKTEIKLLSSKHIKEQDKTYVEIAVGITASNADTFELGNIAIEQVRQFSQLQNAPTETAQKNLDFKRL